MQTPLVQQALIVQVGDECHTATVERRREIGAAETVRLHLDNRAARGERDYGKDGV
jgi:hypothetical protein